MQSSYTQVIVPLGIPKGTSPNVDDITGCTVIRGMQLTVPYARIILDNMIALMFTASVVYLLVRISTVYAW